MRPEELLAEAQRALKMFGPDAEFVLMMPGRWGKRDKRRLAPGGPLGEIVQDNFGRGMAVMFKAADVERWLVESGKGEDS